MTLYLTTADFNRKKQSMLTKEKQSKKTNLLQGWLSRNEALTPY